MATWWPRCWSSGGGLTRSPASALPAGVQRLHGDLRTPETLSAALAEVDGVCHLAGLTKVREARSNPVDYWRTNVGGILAILDRLAGARGGRVVVASTCVVYGEQAEQPISETAPVSPSSPYATSELAADQAAADLAATGAISLRAVTVAAALPGHPDPDATRLIPQLLAVHQGRAPELVVNGDGTAFRGFVHVADMATAFVFALHACEPGTWSAYNVGSGRPSIVHDVIAAVETVTGRPIPRRHCWPTAPASSPNWAGDPISQALRRSSQTPGPP